MTHKKHILVVEDHEPMLGAIKSLLELRGYAVSTAVTGIDALQMMEGTQPDLLIVDILMPEMDGYVFYHEVQKRTEWRSAPVIFLTSVAERADIQRGKELGVASYITKPFEPEDLLTAVRVALEL
jgi:CheY-like chemotaxis protein